MRKFDMPVAFASARSRAPTTQFREVCIPLYLELPPDDGFLAPGFGEVEAEDARIEAGGLTIGGDEDDDAF